VPRAVSRPSLAIALFAAAAAAGYTLAAGPGQELLRSQAETILARVLHGEATIARARLVARNGLSLQGERVAVYPSPSGPALRAERVAIGLDWLSLLGGRFQLDWLVVEDARFEIRLSGENQWSPSPVARLAEREAGRAISMERHLDALRAIDSVTRVLLERAIVANRVELRGGQVLFFDERGAADAASKRAPLMLADLVGRLDHERSGERASLVLRGTFVDLLGTRVPVEALGNKRERHSLELTVAATHLPLESVGPYLGLPTAGSLSGVASYTTPAPEYGAVEIDWFARDLDVRIPLGSNRPPAEDGDAETARRVLDLSTPEIGLTGRLEISPERIWLERIDLAGGDVEVELAGLVERPLSDESRARISGALVGAGLEEIRGFVDWLPRTDRETLTALLSRIESGSISRFGGSGTAPLRDWRKVLDGELARLPIGFSLTARVDDVSVAASEPDQLHDLRGEIEWSGDRMELHDVRASWNDQDLPALDAVIEGFSHLFEIPENERRLTRQAAALPGVSALRALMAESVTKDPGGGAAPRLELSIRGIEHPALRWPLTAARLEIDSRPNATALRLTQGLWGGAPVRAEAIYSDPSGDDGESGQERLRVQIDVSPRTARPPPQPPLEGEQGPALGGDLWASGRFRLGRVEAGPLGVAETTGAFYFAGPRLHLQGVRADLGPKGKIEGTLVAALDDAESVDLEFEAFLEQAELGAFIELFGLPEDLASGDLEVSIRTRGTLVPGRDVLGALEGDIDLKARDGQIRQETPLIVAMAHATEGFNPFSARKSVQFEEARAKVAFGNRVFSTEGLRIEGPMRVFASGVIDAHRDPALIRAVVGVFLFRQAGGVPLFKYFIPGSDKGLVGGYFEVGGQLQDPKIEMLAMESFAEVIPDILKAPFRALQSIRRAIFDGPRNSSDGRQGVQAPASR